jgi:CRISPR-associated exonuclease Cas4
VSVPSSATVERLPLSLLNDFLFCNRRAGLKLIENLRGANVHTVEGDIAHDRVDTPGYHVLRGVKVLRALTVWSDRMGLSGKCDVVEKHPDGSLVPVEFKKSRKKSFINDDVQVCAQGMCIEESLDCEVTHGAIFFAASMQRREIEFTQALRQQVEDAAASLHQLVLERSTPKAEKKKACAHCSLVEVCLPDAMRFNRGTAAWFNRHLELSLNSQL